MINIERIKAWIAALRSEHYRKTMGYLRVKDCFCSTGVLCDLYSKATGKQWEPAFPIFNRPDQDQIYRFGSSAHGPPNEVYEWVGIRVRKVDEDVPWDPNIRTFVDAPMEMNDAGKNFNEVADYLEEQLKLLPA